MKKRRPDGLKLACILLAAVLAVSWASVWFLMRADAQTRGDEVAQRLEQVQVDLDFGGVQAVLQADMDGAAQWLGSENGNLILMDSKGAVIGSLNGNLLDGASTLRLVVSPYVLTWWDSNNLGPDVALALVLDGNGQILQRFPMLANRSDWKRDILPFNQDDPARAALFPALNQALYEAYADYLNNADSYGWDAGFSENPKVTVAINPTPETPSGAITASGGVKREGWMDSYEALNALANGATQADVDAVKRYCEWERGQLKQAGDWCAQMVKAENGLYALALYENNGATNSAYNAMRRRWEVASGLIPLCLLGILALILLMAFWVLRDARKRDFKPALWGILVLLGNVVALIVYLIVRPADCRCPACGANVKRGYLVCPMCAEPLRARCPGCGKPQEDAWVCCPYCGRKKEASC